MEDDEYTARTANSTQNYYNFAHRISETVTEQPTMLVGGKLKEYQVIMCTIFCLIYQIMV